MNSIFKKACFFLVFILSLVQLSMAQKEYIKIKGVVGTIRNGKDGYIAQVTTNDKKVYYVAISIPNLKNGNEYRRLVAEETAELEGEYWMLGDEHRITVRKLYPPTTEAVADNNEKIITVKGTVKDILRGDDGYTATIITKDKKTYFATVSIANMDEGEEYKNAKIGDVIEVTGELWIGGTDKNITVRKIK